MTPHLLVFLGGGLGAVARYVLSGFVGRMAGDGFPWGTLCVNILGAALIGVLVELLALKFEASQHLRLFLVTGILGGFTTFSAFSLEAALMMQKGAWAMLATYIGASVLGTIAAVLLATAAVRQFA